MNVLEPILAGSSGARLGKIVLGTIEGDLHDIGKNLVGVLFRGAGFEVIDIGVDAPKERFLESLRRESARLVGICALLTTALPNLREAVAFLKNADSDGDFKILIGGAAVDGEFAEKVGADGYADDAGAAVQVAKALSGYPIDK
jgi:methanogenic corrinoid protein MtbC1